MDESQAINVKELIQKSFDHNCNIGIIAVDSGAALELRLSRDGTTLARRIPSADIFSCQIDLVAAVFENTIEELEVDSH